MTNPCAPAQANAAPSYDGLLAYRPLKVAADAATVEFELMDNVTGALPGARLQGSVAVLYSFQHITSVSAKEREETIDSFTTLLDAIFPGPTAYPWRPRESLLRPTGNHWGPMRVGPPA